MIDKQQLDETTVPQQYQDVANQWKHHSKVSPETAQKMREAFPDGKPFTTFDLGAGSLPIAIEQHLKNNQWAVHDLAKGEVSKKLASGKTVVSKIKSVLDQIGSTTPEMKARYAAFAEGQALNPSGTDLKVLISTHPHAIAGMSTGTCWSTKSCMDMSRGTMSRYLKDDSEHGTHVAFLVHKDDPTAFKTGLPSNPIARIAVKAYTDESGDTIFRPEHKTYGNQYGAFGDAVSQWASDRYPAVPDSVYHKHDELYDDTRVPVYRAASLDDLKDRIDNGHSISDGLSVDNHVLNQAIEYGVDKFSAKDGEYAPLAARDARTFTANISDTPNLANHHVLSLNRMLQSHQVRASKLPDADEKDVNGELGIAYKALTDAHGDKFNTKMIQEHVNRIDGAKYPNRIPNKILMSHALPESIVDMVEPTKYEFILSSKLKPEHMDKLVAAYHKDPQIYDGYDLHTDLNSSQLAKIASVAGGSYDRFEAHPNFNQEVHDAIVNNPKAAGTDSLKSVLHHSVYTRPSDVEMHGDTEFLQHYLVHPKSEEFHKYAKSKFDSGIDAVLSGESNSSYIPGFSAMRTVPEAISNQMSNDDFKKFAKLNSHVTKTHDASFNFADKNASLKNLDVMHDSIVDADHAIVEKVANGDSDIDTMKSDLRGKIKSYADAIYDHAAKQGVFRRIPTSSADEIQSMSDRLVGDKPEHKSIKNILNFDTLTDSAQDSIDFAHSRLQRALKSVKA